MRYTQICYRRKLFDVNGMRIIALHEISSALYEGLRIIDNFKHGKQIMNARARTQLTYKVVGKLPNEIDKFRRKIWRRAKRL